MNVNEQITQKLRNLLFGVFLILNCSNLNAQAIVCGSVSVSLDVVTCDATITPEALVENPGDFPDLTGFIVELFYDEAMTMPVPTSPVLTGADIGLMIIAQVTNVGGDGNNCWTTIGPVSDYAIPDLNCAPVPINVSCSDNTDPVITPGPGNPIRFPVLLTVTVIDNNDGTYTLEDFDGCGDATLVYSDTEVDGDCPDGPVKTITRTWTATDESGNTTTCMETIVVERITDPGDVDFPDDVILECNTANPPSTHPDDTGYPTVDDNDITTVLNGCELQSTYNDLLLNSCGGSTIINRTWTVYDCMGMVLAGPMDQQIKVLDTTGPTFTCPDDITIGTEQLTCTANTTLPVVVVTDACSGFTTATTATNGTIANGEITGLPLGETTVTFTATDDCGNPSTCMYTITVIDDRAPSVFCETIHTVALTDSEPTLVPAMVFDDGSFDACSAVTFEVRRLEGTQCTDTDATVYGPSVPFYCCDQGEIIEIELRVTDADGNSSSCITGVTVQDNMNPEFTFCPADVTLDCGDDVDDLTLTGEAIASDNCEDLTPTYSDVGDLTCGEGDITRTWSVMDAGGNVVNNCVQTITFTNSNPFAINDTDCNDDDPTDGVVWPCPIMDLTVCGLDNAPSPTELEAAGYTSAEVRPQLSVNACEMDFIVMGYEDSNPITGTGFCRKYIRTWSVYNCCDADHILVAQYDQLLQIIGSSAPTVTCGNVLNVQFPEESQLEITPTDDCTSTANLIVSYEIFLDSNLDATTVDDSGTGTSATDSYPAGLHSIEWSVTDDCGQTTTCQTSFIVTTAAPPSANVSGGILNEEGEEVEHVMVEITGDMDEEEETSNTGTFSFDLPTESNYAVTPERDDNPLNGVSTYDLVKISQHILEVETLSSPYKIIAADVNHSGAVSTIDLVQLRRLILFIDTEFADNTSWRFVDAEFAFPNPANPFETAFPELYTINGLDQDMVADFVGVKVGDVNCSATANGFADDADDRNTGEDLIFTVEDQNLIAGETYTIDFNLNEVTNLQGYQFTLAFDQGALTFENLSPGELKGINENNFGFSLLDQGVITTSWNDVDMLTTQKAVGFSLTFRALTNTQLSQVININSRYTKAEAYVNNESSNVSLAFESENGIVTNHFQLFQNQPNPFKDQTIISFSLPTSNTGTLTIYDLSGRVIKVVKEAFTEGYNEVGVSSAELGGHGVFYYRLDVADYTATRKMVLLK